MSELILKQAEILRRQNNWEAVIKLLVPVVEAGQAGAAVYSALGFAYSQRDQYDKARYCYKQWLELEPGRAQPNYCIGYTFYDASEWREAIEWFDYALELYPDYVSCLYRKGVAQMQMLKEKKAKETLIRAIRSYQKISDVSRQKALAKFFYKSIFYLGKAYYSLENYPNALACFMKINKEDKRNYLAPHIKKYNLAKGFFGVKNYPEAEKILTGLARDERVKNYVLALLGRVQEAMGEKQKALGSLQLALNKRPDAYIFFYRAGLYRETGQLNKALADYRQALRRDRMGKHKTLLALGEIALEQSHLKDAEAYLLRAIAFKKKLYDVDYYRARLALGGCYHLAGMDKKAQKEYEIAAQLRDEQ